MNAELMAALTGIKDGVAAYEPRLTAMQKQLDSIDLRGQEFLGHGTQQKSIADLLGENDSIKRLLQDKRGKAVITLRGKDAGLFQQKTTMTSAAVGSSVTGVLQIQRLPGFTTEARQQLTLRDLLVANPTTFQVIDYVKVSTPLTIASPVVEAGLKPENQLNFVSLSERVKVIATWIPSSRQLLDDMTGLVNFVSNSLIFYVNMAEELQLLSGDGTGENLHGLIPQASPFNPALLKGSWNKIDVLGRAVQQLTGNKELTPEFVVMHPSDWWDVRLSKDGFGHYILGDPQQGALATVGFGSVNPSQNIFGLVVVPTTSIAVGTFLIGTGNAAACEIADRMEVVVEISTEHQDYFTKNLVAIRAEKRLALITRRPGSYVTGTFTTSP